MKAPDIVDNLLAADQIEIKPVATAYNWNGLERPLAWFQGDDFPNAKAAGAFIGSQMVGSLVYEIIPGEMLWLDHAFVKEKYRRQGIFRQMVQWLRMQAPGLPLQGAPRHPAVDRLLGAR
jgi:GNAT superfamily N-acetyltransferase